MDRYISEVDILINLKELSEYPHIGKSIAYEYDRAGKDSREES